MTAVRAVFGQVGVDDVAVSSQQSHVQEPHIEHERTATVVQSPLNDTLHDTCPDDKVHSLLTCLSSSQGTVQCWTKFKLEVL